uniref:DUF6824 domain-containing protein n=1 Tax=Ditylum brightwellii TaxID=49249 RepID=A0A7S4QRX9_9STRA
MLGLDSIALAAAQLEAETASEETAALPSSRAEVDTSVLIASTNENDVLCGRGGETNHHPGNVQYRNLVKEFQLDYLKAKRRDKPKIARKIVTLVRSMTPPGRFLKKASGGEDRKGYWRDVGNVKAREKTSQALREGAPEIRIAAGTEEDAPSSPKSRKRANPTLSPVMVSDHVDSPHEHHMQVFALPHPAAFAIPRLLHSTPPPPPNYPMVQHTQTTSTPQSSLPQMPISRGPRIKRLKARVVSNVC